MFDKKALSGVIVVLLLFLTSLGLFFIVSNWFDVFESDMKIKFDGSNLRTSMEVIKVDGTKLYLKNNFKDDLILNSILIDNYECKVKNIEVDKGSAIVDIRGCSFGFNDFVPREISLVTDYGVYSQYQILRNPVIDSLIISYQFEPCDFSAGYVRLFGLTDLDNAHVDTDGSSVYNVCFASLDYEVSVGSGGLVTQDLFYLIGTNNSAVWTSKGSVFIEPDSWNDLILSSDGGVFDLQIDLAKPSPKHICIGSIDLDDVYGSHFGDCNSLMPDKIWLSLE